MIYAINKRTKEHRVVDASVTYVEWDKWTRVEADAEGWIPWEGGECCPLPEGADYEVRHKDGEVMPKREAETYKDQLLGKGLLSDIIAYRPILDQDTPAEPEAVGWDGEGPCRIGYRVHCIASPSHEVFEVIHWADGMAWLRDVDSGRHELYPCDDIRPLRTAAQRAEEKAVRSQNAMHDAYMEGASGHIGGIRAIFEAIRDGKVPGVKLDNN